MLFFYENIFKKSTLLIGKFNDEMLSLLDELTYQETKLDKEKLKNYIDKSKKRELNGRFLKEAEQKLKDVITDEEVYYGLNKKNPKDLQFYIRLVESGELIGKYETLVHEAISYLDDKYYKNASERQDYIEYLRAFEKPKYIKKVEKILMETERPPEPVNIVLKQNITKLDTLDRIFGSDNDFYNRFKRDHFDFANPSTLLEVDSKFKKAIVKLINEEISKAFEVLDRMLGTGNGYYNDLNDEYINRSHHFNKADFRDRLIRFISNKLKF